jgi:hypothetical protein
MLKRPWVFGAILVMQTLCAVFFLSDIVLTVLGVPFAPIPWAYREVMELAAAGGLVLGAVLGALLLRASLRRTREAENALRAASGAFMELVDEHFEDLGPDRCRTRRGAVRLEGPVHRRDRRASANLAGHGQGADQRDLPKGRRQRATAASVAVRR